MQQLCPDLKAFPIAVVPLQVAVFIVTQKGMPDAGQMRPDLMGTSGKKLHFQQGLVPLDPQRLIFCLNVGIRRACRGDGYLIALPVFLQIPLDQPALCHRSLHIELIIFVKSPVVQQFSKHLCTGKGSGTEHDAACIAVQTVADGRFKSLQILLRYRFAVEQMTDQPFI